MAHPWEGLTKAEVAAQLDEWAAASKPKAVTKKRAKKRATKRAKKTARR